MKTAEQLGIPQNEYDALIKVRDMLDAVPHAHSPADGSGRVSDLFDMNQACTADHTYECGSAMCIGGWMQLVMRAVPVNEKGLHVIDTETAEEITAYVSAGGLTGEPFNAERYAMGIPPKQGVLHQLFFPEPRRNVPWDDITPQHAAQAISNFLRTGSPNWNTVLADVPEYSD